MTGFRPLPRPPRSQWRYRSGVAPDSLFSPKSPDGPGSTETGIHFRLHSITAVMQCQQKSTPSHNNCTSYNSMNKFQKCAVGAVRRAANQNPTIAGGNRTITLSADSRPYSDSSRWYEFAQVFSTSVLRTAPHPPQAVPLPRWGRLWASVRGDTFDQLLTFVTFRAAISR